MVMMMMMIMITNNWLVCIWCTVKFHPILKFWLFCPKEEWTSLQGDDTGLYLVLHHNVHHGQKKEERKELCPSWLAWFNHNVHHNQHDFSSSSLNSGWRGCKGSRCCRPHPCFLHNQQVSIHFILSCIFVYFHVYFQYFVLCDDDHDNEDNHVF